jgi:hypothetical protein
MRRRRGCEWCPKKRCSPPDPHLFPVNRPLLGAPLGAPKGLHPPLERCPPPPRETRGRQPQAGSGARSRTARRLPALALASDITRLAGTAGCPRLERDRRRVVGEAGSRSPTPAPRCGGTRRASSGRERLRGAQRNGAPRPDPPLFPLFKPFLGALLGGAKGAPTGLRSALRWCPGAPGRAGRRPRAGSVWRSRQAVRRWAVRRVGGPRFARAVDLGGLRPGRSWVVPGSAGSRSPALGPPVAGVLGGRGSLLPPRETARART